jgi:hypothetical protein
MINVMTEAGFAEYVAEIAAVPTVTELITIRDRRIRQEAARYRWSLVDINRPSPRPIQIMVDVVEREISRRYW